MNEFVKKVNRINRQALVPESISILQVNVGRQCNQACRHCHLAAGPDRTEAMDRATRDKVIDLIKKDDLITAVDITGGAPELHPDLPYFIEQVRPAVKTVIVRSNLTALDDPARVYLFNVFSDNQVTLNASLPCYLEENVDMIRGRGVYQKSIRVLKKLNQLGYGSGLELNLVYTPAGPDLPGGQRELEAAYKGYLKKEHGIVFNQLLVITNSPIARFKEFLTRAGKLDDYIDLLKKNFNVDTLPAIMCRNLVSVDYQGYLYDCDFNQALDIKINHGAPSHIDAYDRPALLGRRINCDLHCYACTAGQGSSCGGALA